MPPRPKPRSLGDFIEAGTVADGDILRCIGQDSKLLTVGRVRPDGIEVPGEALMPLSSFVERAGEESRNPMERIITGGGRSLAEMLPTVTMGVNTASLPNSNIILDDENDEFCYVCALGGDLICCDTCTAVFHTDCIGIQHIPSEDWHCPACRCCICGHAGLEPTPSLPQVPAKLKCDNYVSSRRSENSLHLSRVVARSWNADSIAATTIGSTVATKCNGPAPNGPDSNGNLRKELKQEQATKGPASRVAVDESGISGAAAIHCAGTDARCHYACLTPEERAGVVKGTAPWFSARAEVQRNQRMAECCTAGAVPMGSLSDGTMVAFQLIRAAAAAGAPCRGIAPAYTNEHCAELRRILSAALQILRGAYGSLQDSRTQADIIPWLLRGASFENGGADFSGMHVAVLYTGGILAAAACVRLLGCGVAEIPLLATRPELQGNKLGRTLLSRIETVLAVAGVECVLTPAFAKPRTPYLLSLFPPSEPLPPPVQASWGYSLVSRSDMVRAAKFRPVRLLGVMMASKQLGNGHVPLPLRPLPPSLGFNAREVDAQKLAKEGVIKVMPRQSQAAEKEAAAAKQAAVRQHSALQQLALQQLQQQQWMLALQRQQAALLQTGIAGLPQQHAALFQGMQLPQVLQMAAPQAAAAIRMAHPIMTYMPSAPQQQQQQLQQLQQLQLQQLYAHHQQLQQMQQQQQQQQLPQSVQGTQAVQLQQAAPPQQQQLNQVPQSGNPGEQPALDSRMLTWEQLQGQHTPN